MLRYLERAAALLDRIFARCRALHENSLHGSPSDVDAGSLLIRRRRFCVRFDDIVKTHPADEDMDLDARRYGCNFGRGRARSRPRAERRIHPSAADFCSTSKRFFGSKAKLFSGCPFLPFDDLCAI
jgi:hypothetical protein